MRRIDYTCIFNLSNKKKVLLCLATASEIAMNRKESQRREERLQVRRQREREARARETAEEREVRLARRRERYRARRRAGS